MIKVYLDNCCYNRPYDDQSQLKVCLQTQAKLNIQEEAINGDCELIWSYVLEYENSQNPYYFKRNAIIDWRNVAKTTDDKLLNKNIKDILIVSPIDYINERR